MTGGADVGEVLVGVNQVAAAWDGSVGSMQSMWSTLWWGRAKSLAASATKYLEQGTATRAAFALHKCVHAVCLHVCSVCGRVWCCLSYVTQVAGPSLCVPVLRVH